MITASSSDQSNKKNIDVKYVEKIRAADADAFSTLFRKYYEILYQFAGRFIRDPQTAESIVQDVFVNIWEKRDNWTITSSVKSYLYTAVRNQSLNYLKHEKIVINASEELEADDNYDKTPEEELIEKEDYEAVHQAINKLPPQCRQVYLMKRYDNLSYMEIAEIQKISINTVKTQMKRAIKALNKHLAHLASFLFSIFFILFVTLKLF